MISLKILFYFSLFIIFWAMIGYPLSLIMMDKLFFHKKKMIKDTTFLPSVTVMVVAHNEEKVIYDKLINLTEINYPKDKYNILISSDNSTDNTNQIVEDFIVNNKDFNINLYVAKQHLGKTNAQNEAQKIVESEILVMTDANSIIEKNAVKELVSSFSAKEISYVCGKLNYLNKDINETSNSENEYWNLDLKLRDIEGRIQTITAGNGALYACRNDEYIDIKAIRSHDLAFPLYFALNNKRAIMNPDANVFEKAGETVEDEFKRKVRMNRNGLKSILPEVRILNVFKYKWFSYFYFGHRTCRYMLWIMHIILLISNVLLVKSSVIYWFYLMLQIIFYSSVLLKLIFKIDNKILNLAYHYAMTLTAQFVGAIRLLSGKSKATWDKAETTR
ncbi:glycosyltransferase [Aerococcaceae bacterium WS4759]|uniref:Glycosyltransferase n=1 Tax=Fundicoccus ignavus TaxID=2664442 RepID=A0A6I2GA24_9LACT|nr:glycosyltransferase [Fundicoccus ignavus]MRI84620.1 glycosyltransferase [Fundicoccus ignavus]